MKKVVVFILAVLYLSTSMGATLHFHYCMGRLVGWDLGDRESKDCISCGMAKDAPMKGCAVGMKNCCRDEHKHIQSDQAQKPAPTWAVWHLAMALILSPSSGWNEPVVVAPSVAHPAANGPPLKAQVPIFLRNCTFRI